MDKSTPVKTYPSNRNEGLVGCCRLCAEPNINAIKLFSAISIRKELNLKIKDIFQINIAYDKETLICRPCQTFLLKVEHFKQKCKSSQEKFVKSKRCLKETPQTTISPSCRQSKKKLKFSPAGFVEHPSSSTPVTSPTKFRELLIASDTSESEDIAKFLITSCPNITKDFKAVLLEDVSQSVTKLCSRRNGSVLYNKDYPDLEHFQFEKLHQEMECHLPFVVQMLKALSLKEYTSNEPEIMDTLQPKFCMIYNICLGARWHELSALKRLVTVSLIEGGSSKKLQQRLNKMGVCLSYSSRDILLDLLGGHFMDKTIDCLKDKKTFRGTGDNWDMKILKHHMRMDAQNEDLHLFASNLIQNRVSFSELPNEIPIGRMKDFKVKQALLCKEEWSSYTNSSAVLVLRILIEFFPEFQIFKNVYPKHIEHQYSAEMAQKSNFATLPIINADERRYQDCVQILRTYEKWIWELYSKAGLTDEEVPVIDEAEQLLSTTAAPGQPHAQVIFTNNDPMKENKIVFAGDQLTRVRFAGAKDLLKGSHTPTDRLEHCSPFKPVMWHTKASLVQYSYNLLFSSQSINEIGTLKYFREKLNRKNVTPQKVVDSFEGTEELLISLGRSYIVVAALDFFEMEKLESKPFDFPDSESSPSQIESYIKTKLELFVKKFVLQFDYDNNHADDFVRNYGLMTIFLAMLVIQMKDTAAEGDGGRNLINQKILIVVFKALNTNSKYAIEMFTSIAQIECTLTPRLSEEFKWGFFMNWRGGAGNNIEDDLAQEICNGLSKKIVKRMGANKSVSMIGKICKATNGIREVIGNLDKSLGIGNGSSHHTSRDSFDDEKEIISDLIKLAPFHYSKRMFETFGEIKRIPHRYLNVVDFHKWFEKCKNQWSFENVYEDM